MECSSQCSEIVVGCRGGSDTPIRTWCATRSSAGLLQGGLPGTLVELYPLGVPGWCTCVSASARQSPVKERKKTDNPREGWEDSVSETHGRTVPSAILDLNFFSRASLRPCRASVLRKYKPLSQHAGTTRAQKKEWAASAGCGVRCGACNRVFGVMLCVPSLVPINIEV